MDVNGQRLRLWMMGGILGKSNLWVPGAAIAVGCAQVDDFQAQPLRFQRNSPHHKMYTALYSHTTSTNFKPADHTPVCLQCMAHCEGRPTQWNDQQCHDGFGGPLLGSPCMQSFQSEYNMFSGANFPLCPAIFPKMPPAPAATLAYA